ncbi:MAG: polyphenol oxidase family protein [Eggerthellaceae bacterium]
MFQDLQIPRLNARQLGARFLPALTDDALFEQTGVRIAFTGRAGGESTGPFASLNVGPYTDDDAQKITANQNLLFEAVGVASTHVVIPRQVHRDSVVIVRDDQVSTVEHACAHAKAGADAVAVEPAGVAAMLCFADCVPVIIVSPTGKFVVTHAGWRGAYAGIPSKSARVLASLDAQLLDNPEAHYNAYIGPHIHACCFETDEELARKFADKYGAPAASDLKHVDLTYVVKKDLENAGLLSERCVEAQICTKCHADEYFSFRASNGVCGRQAAIAVRKEASR